MPLVSILIPAYNAAPWIAETIESALAQTWPDKEIIVVDDGSTDSTVTIARRYEDRGVRVFHQKQGGASAARNRAWHESRGEWLQFLDADDLLHGDKIALQMERTYSLGPDYAYCARWTRFTRSVDDADHTPQPLCRDSEPVAWVTLKLHDNVMMHPAAWLVSRQLADRAGPWNTTLSLDDDGEFFCRVVLASQGVRHVDQAISYYRSNLCASLSRTRTPAACKSALASLELTVSQLLTRQFSASPVDAAIANAFQRLAYALYLSDPALARICEQRALDFGGTKVRPGGGFVFCLLGRVCGWRLALRIQDRWRRVSHANAPTKSSN